MNALRHIQTVSEIEIRLQANEVLVHIPKDTPIGAVSRAIHDAGYKADQSVWLSAEGTWTESGFLPKGWKEALEVTKPSGAMDGFWEFLFKKEKDTWVPDSSKSVGSIPQIRDEGSR